MKFFSLILAFLSLSSFAQVPGFRGQAQFGGFQLSNVTLLPMEADVTSFFVNQEFDDLTVRELEITLLSTTVDEDAPFQIGASGITLFNQSIVLANGEIRHLQGIKPLALEVLGFFKKDEKIILHYKAHADFMVQAGGDNLHAINPEIFDRIVTGNTCANCVLKAANTYPGNGHTGINLEAEVGLKFYDLHLIFYAKHLQGSDQSYYIQTESDEKISKYYGFSQIKQNTLGAQIGLDILSDTKLGTLAIYASYEFIYSKQVFKDQVRITKNGQYIRDDLYPKKENIGNMAPGSNTYVELGVKWTLPAVK